MNEYIVEKKQTSGGWTWAEPKGKLIRCKDCIYWEEYWRIVDGVASDHVCSNKREIDGAMHRVKADDFCSWAVRKEDDELRDMERKEE